MAREPQRHLESDLAHERRVFNRPADYYRSYGHRHNLPALSKVNWREGLIWRWNTADVQVVKGHGAMACYLARLPFWQRIMRRLFETYHAGEWREQESPKLLPTEDKEFRYPPGLDLSAFWFRLDTESGPRNPRDPGFEWAWEKPLLPVEQVQQRWGMVSPHGERAILDFIRRNKDEVRQVMTPDPEWQEFMDSDFVDYEQFKLWKEGKAKSPGERLHDFDARYKRPACKCGRSHPELHTPMKKTSDSWNYRGSFYRCGGCGRKWRTKNLKAAIDGAPLPSPVSLKPEQGIAENHRPEREMQLKHGVRVAEPWQIPPKVERWP